ncbi:MAG: diacylglycerol kinase [Halieaceae bacterium]|nr:diacylglycerol kinase [Halieaceae bacterium]
MLEKQVIKRTGFARLLFTIVNSGKGLTWLLKNEEAFQLEFVLALVLIPTAFFIGTSPSEVSLMIFATLFVLVVETLNTAVETTIDRISSDYHQLSGLAKDLGSLAVTFSLIIWLVIWTPIAWMFFTG